VTGYDGIVLVDKPEGLTSARVVARVRSVAGKVVKVGHLGTLDPFASGLLPLCLGAGTKIAQFLNLSDKAYTGQLRLGVTSNTLDRTGELKAGGPVPRLSEQDLRVIERRFSGPIEQVPPVFSAIKKGGVPLYRLARKGIEVEVGPRTVTVHRLTLAPAGPDRLRIDLECSKGTYVRSIARDIGEQVGCGALLEELRRTGFGPFRIEDAVALERLTDEDTGATALAAAVIPPHEALGHLPVIEVDGATADGLRYGRQAVLSGLAPQAGESGACARVVCRGSLVAVVALGDEGWRLSRVFA
jgi:tRNA pseudouridine55 synthase